jgi:hypothetical protein
MFAYLRVELGDFMAFHRGGQHPACSVQQRWRFLGRSTSRGPAAWRPSAAARGRREEVPPEELASLTVVPAPDPPGRHPLDVVSCLAGAPSAPPLLTAAELMGPHLRSAKPLRREHTVALEPPCRMLASASHAHTSALPTQIDPLPQARLHRPA